MPVEEMPACSPWRSVVPARSAYVVPTSIARPSCRRTRLARRLSKKHTH